MITVIFLTRINCRWFLEDAYLDDVRKTLPELPAEKAARFVSELGLSEYDAGILTASRALADYFETVTRQAVDAKLAANWLIGDVSARLNKDDLEITQCPVSANDLAGMLKRIADNTISGKIAKDVFNSMWNGEGDADTVIESKGLKQITDDSAIEAMIDEVIASSPDQLQQYRAGKDKLFGYFVGQIMKASQGKANPAQVNTILKAKLDA